MSQQIGTVATTADFVAMALPTRRDSAITYPRLAHRIFGVPLHPVTPDEKRLQRNHVRKLQEIVVELRRAGVPVCGGPDGLWRAVRADEALQAYRSLRRRYIGQAVTARALLRTAQAMERAEQSVEQTSLWEAA